MAMARPKKLTEEQWRRVFQLRCRSKQGQDVSQEDLALVYAAFHEDLERYSAMEVDVFNATVPFGSSVRRTK
jgi:hypothetical protein